MCVRVCATLFRTSFGTDRAGSDGRSGCSTEGRTRVSEAAVRYSDPHFDSRMMILGLGM